MSTLRPWMGIACLVGLLVGCGGSEPRATSSDASSAGLAADVEAVGLETAPPGQTEDGDIIPVAATETAPAVVNSAEQADEVESSDDEDFEAEGGEPVSDVEPTKGSPAWQVREIAKLQVEPFANTENLDELRQARIARNEKIIAMAAEVIKATHKDKKQERLFDVAVHHMLEARLQLALQGDRESVDALYDDAASLWERNRNSKAAADAAYTLVTLAYSNAKQTAPKDLKWLKEFARQANHFLASFPKEQRRSIPLAFTAARSCELHGLTEDAVKSYATIQKTFPESEQAERVTGILRRLKLKGDVVQLGGPTLDGNHVALNDFAGKVIVAIFWSQQAKPFLQELSQLKQLERKFAGKDVVLLGVCLDNDAASVTQFVKDQDLRWPQIFYTEEGKRGWNNPVANYYGILEVGIWLIDQNGRAVSTSLKADDLEAKILPLLKRGTPRREPKNPQR